MQHHFDVKIAEEFGILEAVLLENISFWIMKNAANEKNYFEGDYWTYNSCRAFAELFPYATDRQIKYALDKLKDAGIIKVGNFNQNAYDRTLWYGLTEKGKCMVENRNFHLTKLSNGKDKIVKPIPYNKPDTKPDNKPIPKGIEKTPEKYGNPEINELFEEWEKHCGFRIDTKIKMNRYACQRLIKSRGFEKVKKAIPYVAEAQSDQYAPGVNNFIDLAEKWNNLAIWYKKKNLTNFMKNGKIVIPDDKE